LYMLQVAAWWRERDEMTGTWKSCKFYVGEIATHHCSNSSQSLNTCSINGGIRQTKNHTCMCNHHPQISPPASSPQAHRRRFLYYYSSRHPLRSCYRHRHHLRNSYLSSPLYETASLSSTFFPPPPLNHPLPLVERFKPPHQPSLFRFQFLLV
jgi:hypothetical protein